MSSSIPDHRIDSMRYMLYGWTKLRDQAVAGIIDNAALATLPARPAAAEWELVDDRGPTLRLEASCLWSKWGFGDGDSVGYFCDANNIDLRGRDDHAVLGELVERYLLPAMKHKVTTQRMMTCHNPIRVTRDFSDFEHWGDEAVEVTIEQVIAVIAAMPPESPM